MKKKIDLTKEINRLMTTEGKADMHLTIADQQFLIRYLDLRDYAITDELIRDVAETIAPVLITLSSIEIGLKSIASDITSIKQDINNIKDRLEIIEDTVEKDELEIKDIKTRLDVKRMEINLLKQQVALLKPELVEKLIEDFEYEKPKFDKLVRYSSFWNTVYRMVIAALVGGGLWYMMVWYSHSHWK